MKDTFVPVISGKALHLTR